MDDTSSARAMAARARTMKSRTSIQNQTQRSLRSSGVMLAGLVLLASGAGCSEEEFTPANPARGPGEFVGESRPLNSTFAGGASPDIQPRSVEGEPNWRSCGQDCQDYCDAQPFDNPVDDAMCPYLWGTGLDTLPVDDERACRRLFLDLRGTFPSYDEIAGNCLGRPISGVAEKLIESDEFVFLNQRRWADILRYNNVALNLERIYDADVLVGKLYSGRLRYDKFLEVVSAHPVLVRRFDDASDRVEALFNTFVGRPPYDNERADMAKLYALWQNDYFDHPQLGLRLPDAFIEHRCIGESGQVDETTSGACTSIEWGFHRVVLKPDHRAVDNRTWSENLTKEEWQLLQTPGRIMATWPVVWEHAVEQVLAHYLGYDLVKDLPPVTQKLVEYVLAHSGDIRAAHYAVVTSQIYLQSTECSGADCGAAEAAPPWTYGPLRQADAEAWIDSLTGSVGQELGACDHRLPNPNQLLRDSPMGYELVAASRWPLDLDADRLEVSDRYANLAQTLGGCPDNEVSGRFKAVGILSTATQEAFVTELCNPAMVEGAGVGVSRLLPEGVSPSKALDESVAEEILGHQVGTFFSRMPLESELAMARTSAQACVPKPCDAESFARASCYALLSSSEMLFY